MDSLVIWFGFKQIEITTTFYLCYKITSPSQYNTYLWDLRAIQVRHMQGEQSNTASFF